MLNPQALKETSPSNPASPEASSAKKKILKDARGLFSFTEKSPLPEFADLAMACLREDPDKRPTFSQVVGQVRFISWEHLCPSASHGV